MSNDLSIRVIGAASGPAFELGRMSHEWPDVTVLDAKMSCMDVITFLRKAMAERPAPVEVCSILAEHGAVITYQAVEADAA